MPSRERRLIEARKEIAESIRKLRKAANLLHEEGSATGRSYLTRSAERIHRAVSELEIAKDEEAGGADLPSRYS